MSSAPLGASVATAPAAVPNSGGVPVEEIAGALVELGCPADRSPQMAAQLDKRARQLAGERAWTYEQSLAHLLRLMAGGWAAPGATGRPPADFPSR